MSPGLPVIGLGALFCVLSALAAPVVEVWRRARGETSVAGWLQVGRQFALAVATIAAFYVTLRLVYTLVAGTGFSQVSARSTVTLPSMLIGVSVAVLAALLAAAKGIGVVLRTRSGHPSPPAVRARRRPRRLLLQGAGVLAAAWFPLLAFGTTGLSPHSDGLVSRGAVPALERAGADVAGAASARKRVHSRGDDRAQEAGAAPIADGVDAPSYASSSGGEGTGTVGSPSLAGGELVEQAPEYDVAVGGGTGDTGQGPSTGGVAAPSK